MKVLIAVDGSSTAEHVVEAAVAFPLPADVDVEVVSVCPVPDLHSLGHHVTGAINEMVDICRADAERIVSKSKQRLTDQFTEVQTIVESGHPAKSLLHAIHQQHSDLVFIGARGMGVMDRLLVGSVSDRVVRHAHCSVVVVRPQAGHTRPNHILVAFDNSPGARKAIELLAAMEHPSDTHVRVVSILPRESQFRSDMLRPESDLWAKEVEHVQAGLDWAVEKLRPQVPSVTSALREADHVAEELLKIEIDFGADLIVVGDTGKNALERFVLGSVSTQVLHHAKCSVWISRDQQG